MDIRVYIEIIENMLAIYYGKQIYFYDDNKEMWYSRQHCSYLTPDDIEKICYQIVENNG